MAAPDAPGPASDSSRLTYSPAVQTTVEVLLPAGPQLAWDGYWRSVYDRMNVKLAQQAETLLTRSNIEIAEKTPLLIAQRNALIVELRKPLSPFGKLFSELKKPVSAFKTTEQLLAEKGTFQAILKSVGKTNQVVDNFAFTTKVAGRGLIVLQIVISATVIITAPPDQRGRVAARQAGQVAGGAGGYAAGAWAGCSAAVAVGLPSLAIPIWGEAAEATVCVIGGIGGGLGLGYYASEAGGDAGEMIYDYVADMTWSDF